MLNKLAATFAALRKDMAEIRADLTSVSKIRAIVPKDGEPGAPGADGETPDVQAVVDKAVAQIPAPDVQAMVDKAVALIPAATPGRDAVAPTVADVAAVVLSKIPKPKDGVTPDVAAIVEKVAAMIPTPKDGETPDVGAIAEKTAALIPAPKPGAKGEAGDSVTKVSVEKNILYYWLAGIKKRAGKIDVKVNTFDGGGGSGASRIVPVTPPFYVKQVVVREAVQLSGDLSSEVDYRLDGVIDFTGTGYDITAPVNGLNLSGHNANVSGLRCDDDNYTLFTDPVGGCGDIIQNDIMIEVTGTGSKVYGNKNANGAGLFLFSSSIFQDCTSLGFLDSFFQAVESTSSRRGGSPTLELRGPWAGGYRTDGSNIFGLVDGAYTLYKAGLAFTMASRFRTNQSVALPASASLCDFSPANFPNPSTLQFDGVIVTRNGVTDASDPNITPNILASDLASDWADNVGLPNTFVGGEVGIVTEVTTPIVDANTFVDILGTTIAEGLQHFDSPANGQLRHLGTSPREYKLSGQYVMDAAGNDEVSIKVVVFRSATTTFEDQKTITRTINNIQGGRNVAYFALSNNIVLNQNDYVKLQTANNNVTDVTAELNSFYTVEAR